MRTVYYLGPEGTFSHILARRRFGASSDLRPCHTIEEVVESAAHERGAFGLVPVENSSGGTVHDSIDVLIRRSGEIHVVEELAMNVRIALLGRGRGPVKVVFSHFTQLKHHADWLRALYPGVRLRAVESTGLAATRAAATSGGAALASPGAAKLYGLEILEAPRTAHKKNVTHFYVIRPGAPPDAPPREPSRTALIVTLPDVCGSLHAFLGPFARHGISLSRIVSRPVPGQPETYVFFIEIEGHPGNPPTAAALRAARRKSASLGLLGAFPCGRKFRS